MYKPKTETNIDCSCCQQNVVFSNAQETGTFYIQYGRAYDATTRDYTGNYCAVMFAICSECAEL